MLVRESHNKSYLILGKNRQALEISRSKLHRRLKVNSLIRFWPKDFYRLQKMTGYLTHFNLEATSHKKGRTYALVKIAHHGFFAKQGKEQKPVLDLKGYVRARCLKVKNKISYHKISQDVFEHSLPNIKSVGNLKKAIYSRYHKSLPKLSQAKMLALGVGVTYLKLIHR